MSARVVIQCDGCGVVAGRDPGPFYRTAPGTPGRARAALRGWSNDYIHRPYAGKRADFCPRCTKKNERRRDMPGTYGP